MTQTPRHDHRLLVCLVALLVLAFGQSALAYEQYSQDGGSGNCANCHGPFRANSYISLTDGTNWGNLHNMHRNDILNGDCATCHGGGDEFPVVINQSDGGSGLDPIACVGCHGRAEDNHAGNPDFPNGVGAGLRQHHFSAGVTVCTGCHQDANPSNFAVVGEDILPPYFANPGSGHPNIPGDACNADGSENFRGDPEGLDNDGDNVYDTADSDCGTEGCWLNCPAGDGGLINANGDGNKSPDIDGDGEVSVVDFALFASAFGGTDPCSDFDCNGSVSVADFAIFAAHFQHGPGPAGVCE